METSQKICRLCMKRQSRSFPNFFSVDDELKIILKIVVPELDLTLSTDLNVCHSCRNSLSNFYIFRKECLKVEGEIKHYKSIRCIEKVDLIDVVKYSEEKATGSNSIKQFNNVSQCEKKNEPQEKRLPGQNSAKYERKNEPQERCSSGQNSAKYERKNEPQERRLSGQNSAQDIASTENGVNERKRHYPGGISDPEPQKRQKVTSPPLRGRDIKRHEASQLKYPQPETVSKKTDQDELVGFLPDFPFRHKFNRLTKDSIEQWCKKVDKVKQKQNWSDNTVIAIATKKLKFINAIKDTYMKPDVSWNEWKDTILQAFPETIDFSLYMRTVLDRTKTDNETYVEYYRDKMDILSERTLSEDRLISCLIHGIQEKITSILARIRNFKTPEELLEYFKTCDDRDHELKQVCLGREKPNKNTTDKINTTWQMLHKCGNCGRLTHLDKYCPQPRKTIETSNVERKSNEHRRTRSEMCSICHNYGHEARNCSQSNKREKFGNNSRNCVQVLGRDSRR